MTLYHDENNIKRRERDKLNPGFGKCLDFLHYLAEVLFKLRKYVLSMNYYLYFIVFVYFYF